jgi:hypothetical protein
MSGRTITIVAALLIASGAVVSDAQQAPTSGPGGRWVALPGLQMWLADPVSGEIYFCSAVSVPPSCIKAVMRDDWQPVKPK